MNKKVRILFVALSLLVIGIAFFVGLRGDKQGGPAKKQPTSKSDKKITAYYVPVTNYFSLTSDVKKVDLEEGVKKGNLYLEESEKNNLIDIIGPTIKEAKTIKPEELTLSEDQIAIVRWDRVNAKLRTLKYEGQLLWGLKDLSAYPLKKEILMREGEGLEEYRPEMVTRLRAGGDVMLSRNVAQKISALGVLSPWKYISSFLSDADITFVNLEVPLSDRLPSPSSGMSFIAPTKNIEGLFSAGIDVVSVANNHSANFGQKVFEDNLANLKKANIGACGGGSNLAAARTPIIIEKNNLRFAFLCYNSITGGLAAKAESSGIVPLYIEPWYRDDAASIDSMVADIKKAREIADVVIVSPHWGVEYKLNQSASQQKVSEAAIAAGADLILGTHPHVIQGSEIMSEKYITYSLGNLIFDQEWSQETKEGLIFSGYFYNKKLVFGEMVPVVVENYHQPKFASGDILKKIIERLKSASKGF